MGVGPTWGTIAGDPTSNLGRLGPELLQQVAGDDKDSKAAEGGAGSSSMAYTRSDEQPSPVFASSPHEPAAAASHGNGLWAHLPAVWGWGGSHWEQQQRRWGGGA
jgi:hypothetical protein